MTTAKKQGGQRPGAGRKKIGEERGGLVPLLVQVYMDQAKRLQTDGNQSQTVREALDNFFRSADR